MTLLICCPPLLAVMRVRCLRLSSRISCPECTVSTPMPYVPASAFTITKGGLSMSYSAYLRWIFWISVSTLRATQSSPSRLVKLISPHLQEQRVDEPGVDVDQRRELACHRAI